MSASLLPVLAGAELGERICACPRSISGGAAATEVRNFRVVLKGIQVFYYMP